MTTDSSAGEFSHLQKRTAREALLPDKERIAIIRAGSWLDIEPAKTTVTTLQEMLEGPRITRPHWLLLLGESNSGKTSIFEKFLSNNPVNTDPESPVGLAPVVKIECPSLTASLYIRILDALFANYSPSAKSEAHRASVIRLFRDLGVRVLLIDEVHDALAGTMKQQNDLRVALKQLSNETKVNIAAAGIPKARTFFAADAQMTSRFKFAIELPEWKPDDALGTLLVSMERRIPLRNASNLKEPAIMAAISSRAAKTLGDICDLVKEAAVSAILDPKKPEKIDVERITSLKWTSPTNRSQFMRTPRPGS